MAKLKVMFLCTGNSCRSQMAEGWARALKGEVIEAYSAGITPHGMNGRAVAVMREAGVDLASHRSKHADELRDVKFDYVVTVCGHADATCPGWLREGTVVHRGFDDPPAIAREMGQGASEEAILAPYRRVRDEIRAWVETLPESLHGGGK